MQRKKSIEEIIESASNSVLISLPKIKAEGNSRKRRTLKNDEL